MTVRDNVAFGLAMRRRPKAECIRLAERALGIVGLSGMEGRRIHEISGGQRQRVALARAIVIEPAVLLLDEPLGALDVKIRRQMQDELVKLQRSLGATFIHVTHDQEEAMSIADTIVLLNKGKIEDMGPPERVYRQPASMFAATFMGDTNILKGVVSSTSRDTVAVDTPVGVIHAAGRANPGEEVHLSIRPERMQVGDTAHGGAIRLGRGKFQDVVYQGSYRRSRIILDGSQPTSLLVHMSVDHPAAPEDETSIWVKPSDVVVLQ
jgi:spermidine/putrescine transport system ATP-binding protein